MERILDKKFNDKYQQKIIESFNSRLELYLFNLAKDKGRNNIDFNKDEFLCLHDNINYKDDSLMKKCKEYGSSFSSPPVDYKDIDWKIEVWCGNNIDNSNLEKYYDEYSEIFKTKLLTKEDYKKISNSDYCYYCKTRIDDIKKLFIYKKIYRKSYTRGISFELDRKIPNWEYSKSNTVACCYWCNNAKTDEFYGEEFEIIGLSIGEIFSKRLKELG